MTLEEQLKLKPKDKVICVISNAKSNTPPNLVLVEGQEYVIHELVDGDNGKTNVKVSGIDNGFFMMRFRLKQAYCSCGDDPKWSVWMGCKCGAAKREQCHSKLPRIVKVKNRAANDPYHTGMIGFVKTEYPNAYEVQMFVGTNLCFAMIPKADLELHPEFPAYVQYLEFIEKHPEFAP